MRNLSHKRNISVGMKLLGLPVAVLVGAALMWAQAMLAQAPAPSGGDDSQVPTFRGGTQNVQAPVTVLDRDGHTVNGLNALDFTLLDNGVPQPIVEDLSMHPISLVVVVQASANMEKILPGHPADRQPVRRLGDRRGRRDRGDPVRSSRADAAQFHFGPGSDPHRLSRTS